MFIIYTERHSDFKDMMERYEKEMRRLFEQQARPAMVNVEQSVEEKEPLTEPVPVPVPVPAKPVLEEKEEQALPQNEQMGSLLVEVTTAKGAVPLSGVTVVIDRIDKKDEKGRKELIKIEHTGADGRTKPIMIETVSKDLSLTPGNIDPFATVYVSAQINNFEPARNRPVDIFMGEESILKIDLVPKPENLAGEVL